MAVITYTAQRKLVSGHSADTQYQLELSFQQAEPTIERHGYEQESLDLSRSSYLYTLADVWQIQTDVLTWASDLDDWQEFIASVANGETFAVDFTGTIAAPGTDVNMVMVGKSWAFQRQGSLAFTVAFRCREA